MPAAPRVQSLKSVGEILADGGEFSYALRDFLDGFYEQPREKAVTGEPPRLAGMVTDGEKLDAYLAAVAEHFCRMHRWRLPAWTSDACRFLDLPWFGMQSHAGRMLLLMDSPSAFRARNIFVSADALTRA